MKHLQDRCPSDPQIFHWPMQSRQDTDTLTMVILHVRAWYGCERGVCACLDEDLGADALARRERHEGEHHSARKHREGAKPKCILCQRLHIRQCKDSVHAQLLSSTVICM